jgi:hypothetical protein
MIKKILFGFVLFLYIGISGQVFADNDIPAESKTTASESSGGDKYKVTIDSFSGEETVEAKNGIELITKYIAIFYKAAAGIIGIICVLIIVVSGMQISVGGLDPEGVNKAKERILQAIFSMILLFSSAAILKTINSGFFT